MKSLLITFSLTMVLLPSCGSSPVNSTLPFQPTNEQKEYWYNGEAELTSFKLTQARYGELREGTAVMIFVTEDFSTTKFTKTDKEGKDKTSVLKLNFTKNFTTGIYPYSILTSSFVPFSGEERALKISTSIQEWCGHVYMELVRKKFFNINIQSYFEDETIVNLELPIAYLEDELWSMIRLNPAALPIGNTQVIPSFSYLRMMHVEPKAYDCEIKVALSDSANSTLNLYYKELDRSLSITYQTEFPYQIVRWEEVYLDGFGTNKQKLKTTGERIKTIRSAYWTKNKNSDQHLRKELGLE